MGDIHQITKQAPQTQANLSLISFNVLANHVIDARSTHDEFLGSSRLLIGGTQESSLIYVYDHRKVLCVQGNDGAEHVSRNIFLEWLCSVRVRSSKEP